jgi:hypothetical protein
MPSWCATDVNSKLALLPHPMQKWTPGRQELHRHPGCPEVREIEPYLGSSAWPTLRVAVFGASAGTRSVSRPHVDRDSLTQPRRLRDDAGGWN